MRVDMLRTPHVFGIGLSVKRDRLNIYLGLIDILIWFREPPRYDMGDDGW